MSDALQRHLKAFEVNPDDSEAFEALEEYHFAKREWEALAELYRKRAEAPSLRLSPKVRASLLFRRGQILEERCLDLDRALEQYLQVVRTDPQFRPALLQARRIYVSRAQWDRVLEIAELQERMPMKPHERASFLTEMGSLWLEHLSDSEKALRCFDRALQASPDREEALAGRARALVRLRRPEDAAEVLERLLGIQRGPDRAVTAVSLARLLAGPLGEPERALELYRRALTDDPRNEDALEALAMLAAAREQWPLLADLYERRFELAKDPERRAAIAVEAGSLHAERLEEPQVARMWFQRALELRPEDVSVRYALAGVERRAGNTEALLRLLEEQIARSGKDSPASLLLEAAGLHSEAGDDERALALLKLARERAPADPRVLDSLVRVLGRLGQHGQIPELLEQRAALAGENLEERARCLAELGRIHEEDLGDAEAAVDALTRALRARPDAPGVAGSLERLHRKREAWEALRDLLDVARREGPEAERVGYHCALGDLLLDRFHDPSGATKAFESALEVSPESTLALRGLSRIAEGSGEEEAVLRAYEREAAATSEPGRLELLVSKLERMLEARGRREDALRWVQKLVESAPADARALQSAARLHRELGQREEELSLLERLDPLLSGPDQSANRRRAAALLGGLGRAEDAARWYEAALENDPDDLESLRGLKALYESAGRLENVARVQQKLAELLPPGERARCLYELALLFEEQLGDAESALGVLRRLVRLEECPEGVPERLEALLERMGRFADLAERLLEVRQSLPEASDEAIRIDLRRARLLRDRLGEFAQAATILRSVRSRAPSSTEAIEELEATLRGGSDRAALAELLLERAREEGSPSRRAALAMESAMLWEESGEFDRPRSAYAALAERCPDDAIRAEATRRLEALLERSGDAVALRAHLESLVGRGSAEEELALHERLAALCRELGELPGCIEHLEAIGRIAPTRAETWRSLALLYEETGRRRELARALEAELATRPDAGRELELRVRAGRLYSEEGPEERAAAHYTRVLELEPTHAEASEFLVAHHERNGRPLEVVRLLEARLAMDTPRFASAGDDAERSRRTSLRTRIAALRSEALGDVEGAIAVLQPALEEVGAVASVVEPLAALYERAGHRTAQIDLCRRASRAGDTPDTRAEWLVRLGETLRGSKDQGDLVEAVGAYQAALAERPDDGKSRSALCDLYRRLERAAPLAALLEQDVERQPGSLPIRMELAALLAGPLGRPMEALEHYRRIVELDPRNRDALARAAALAGSLERHEDSLELIDAQLELPATESRAAALEKRGDLLAGPLGRLEDAAAAYREAFSLDPARRGARERLRAVLEKLERWPAVLCWLDAEAREASGAQREAILERAAVMATSHLGPDAALPWLERLRVERPEDPAVVARIAEVHRRAGRFEAVLRALEEEIPLLSDSRRKRDLHLERARLLEHELQSPGRAASAVEAARALLPDDPELLDELERLYGRTGRLRDEVGVIEARIRTLGAAPPQELAQKHRAAAALWAGPLARPDLAVPHLLRAVSLSQAGSSHHVELLRELEKALRAIGRVDLWTQAAEAELASLGAEEDRRRAELREELAWTYEQRLGRPEAALPHLSALAEHADSASADPNRLDRAERALLARLRVEHNSLELERRLGARLARGTGGAEEWLELARLRSELGMQSRARDAYRELLSRSPGHGAALAELRALCERAGDWPEVARTLELELARASSGPERAALLRRLGEVLSREIGDPERAAQALSEALRADPHDLETLRSLRSVHELQAQWREELELCEREITLLDDREPTRRQELWLRIGALARDRAGDPARSLRAYERAAEIGELAPEREREWADLYRVVGDRRRYVEVLSRWCDDGASGAGPEDYLALANALEELGRTDEAIACARRATEARPDSAEAAATAARLHEAKGETREAAAALAHAAELMQGPEAIERLVRAAILSEPFDRERAATLLRRAVERDPACARALAHLARVTADCGAWEEAERAAARALDVGSGHAADRGLDAKLRLATALVGGQAARERGRLEAAVGFFAEATELEPACPEALEAQGELLFSLGDLEAAERALKRRMELGGTQPRRARHLAILGRAVELRDPQEALDRYRAALEVDPDEPEAHAGIVRIHEGAGRTDDAVRALERWAEAAGEPKVRAECLRRAADLALAAGKADAAEEHLRATVEVDPKDVGAWMALVERLWDGARRDEALDAATNALAHVAEEPARARLCLVRARCLEARGERSAAAAAYAEAARCDSSNTEACLAQARLLREAGRWREASEALEAFARRDVDSGSPPLARVLLERGHLLAGPLEDVAEAVRCYERALELEPGLWQARECLARLLARVPGRWREAVEQHRVLLAAEPLRPSSLRDLLEIAKRRTPSAVQAGLAILRALGIATPEECEDAPALLALRVAGEPRLEPRSFDQLRLAAQAASRELSEALASREPPLATRGQGAPVGAFRAALRRAEGELAPPALLALSTDAIGASLRTLAALALGSEPDDRALEDPSLARSIGRWTLRKLRRVLDGVTLEEVKAIDFCAWRAELGALAGAWALDETGGDLRSALLALSTSAESGRAGGSGAGPRFDGDSSVGRKLLARVVSAWCTEILGGS